MSLNVLLLHLTHVFPPQLLSPAPNAQLWWFIQVGCKMQKKASSTTVTFLLYFVYVVTMSENSSPEKVNLVQCLSRG